MWEKYDEAKRLEKESKWREAAKIWESIRYYNDRDACNLIADSIEKGDRFRDMVRKKCGECPDVPNPNDSIAFRKYINCLQQVSKNEVL